MKKEEEAEKDRNVELRITVLKQVKFVNSQNQNLPSTTERAKVKGD